MKRRDINSTVAALVASSTLLIVISWSYSGTQRTSELEEPVSGFGSAPYQPNSLLQFQVPVSQLSQTKVGDVISGQVPYSGVSGGQVSFSGQVTNGYMISPSLGSLTVRR